MRLESLNRNQKSQLWYLVEITIQSKLAYLKK